MTALKLCLWAVVLLLGCGPFAHVACSPTPSPLPPGPVPEPPPITDAGPDADPVVARCLAAEAVVCELHCVDALGAELCAGPTGVRFGARCVDEIRRGMPWDAECLGTITECDQIDAAAMGTLCDVGGP